MANHNSNINRRTPYFNTYDEIINGGTDTYFDYYCHKCGWTVDQEDCIETSNSYMYATANVRRYHKICYE